MSTWIFWYICLLSSGLFIFISICQLIENIQFIENLIFENVFSRTWFSRTWFIEDVKQVIENVISIIWVSHFWKEYILGNKYIENLLYKKFWFFSAIILTIKFWRHVSDHLFSLILTIKLHGLWNQKQLHVWVKHKVIKLYLGKNDARQDLCEPRYESLLDCFDHIDTTTC